MVTKSELKKMLAEEKEAEEQERKEREKRWKKEQKERMKQYCEEARTALDGRLGEVIKAAARKGETELIIDPMSGKGSYGAFTEPGYKPTKILMDCLKKAEFKAKIKKESYKLYDYEIDGDGGQGMAIPGSESTHYKHVLTISWD